MKRKIVYISNIVLILLLFASPSFAYDFQIIVNKDNPVSQATKEEVAKWFLKKKTTWPNGEKIEPVDQKSSAKIRKDFSKEILNKSVSAVKSYWQRMIFSGRGVPPIEKENDQQVIEYVKNHPGAVGYVSKDAKIEGVKKINIK